MCNVRPNLGGEIDLTEEGAASLRQVLLNKVVLEIGRRLNKQQY